MQWSVNHILSCVRAQLLQDAHTVFHQLGFDFPQYDSSAAGRSFTIRLTIVKLPRLQSRRLFVKVIPVYFIQLFFQ